MKNKIVALSFFVGSLYGMEAPTMNVARSFSISSDDIRKTFNVVRSNETAKQFMHTARRIYFNKNNYQCKGLMNEKEFFRNQLFSQGFSCGEIKNLEFIATLPSKKDFIKAASAVSVDSDYTDDNECRQYSPFSQTDFLRNTI